MKSTMHVFDLFFNLDATEEQLTSLLFMVSAKHGWFNDCIEESEDITPLLDGIIKLVPPPVASEGTLQMQITSLDYSSFQGRIAIGKVNRGADSKKISHRLVAGRRYYKAQPGERIVHV